MQKSGVQFVSDVYIIVRGSVCFRCIYHRIFADFGNAFSSHLRGVKTKFSFPSQPWWGLQETFGLFGFLNIPQYCAQHMSVYCFVTVIIGILQSNTAVLLFWLLFWPSFKLGENGISDNLLNMLADFTGNRK